MTKDLTAQTTMMSPTVPAVEGLTAGETLGAFPKGTSRALVEVPRKWMETKAMVFNTF